METNKDENIDQNIEGIPPVTKQVSFTPRNMESKKESGETPSRIESGEQDTINISKQINKALSTNKDFIDEKDEDGEFSSINDRVKIESAT